MTGYELGFTSSVEHSVVGFRQSRWVCDQTRTRRWHSTRLNQKISWVYIDYQKTFEENRMHVFTKMCLPQAYPYPVPRRTASNRHLISRHTTLQSDHPTYTIGNTKQLLPSPLPPT